MSGATPQLGQSLLKTEKDRYYSDLVMQIRGAGTEPGEFRGGA